MVDHEDADYHASWWTTLLDSELYLC